MPEIKTVYLISHVHTDIGYTDSQNVLFRQQLEFIDRESISARRRPTIHPKLAIAGRAKWRAWSSATCATGRPARSTVF